MDHFNYRNNQIFAEDLSVCEIAKKIRTPFYLYSTATLTRHYQIFDEATKSLANKLICYAVKANSNLAILRLLSELGSGADVVSEGEIYRALKAGIKPEKIVFSGIGKTEEEISYALKERILQFNCESFEEIENIAKLASSMEVKANIVIRINPNIDAHTNSKISTGKKGDKFGIDIEDAGEAITKIHCFPSLNFQGLSVHIGSQITQITPFEKAFTKLFEFIASLEAKKIRLEVIDLGGGIGVPYGENEVLSLKNYGDLVTKLAKKYELENKKFIFEPGRLLVANAGILVSKIILIKRTKDRNFAICDAAMNDLIRPALYDAKHQIIPIIQPHSSEESESFSCSSNNNKNATEIYDFVGPICETADIFAKNLSFPKLAPHDLIAFRSTGAYGSVMSSEYNSRPLIQEVLVSGDQFRLIRKRPSYEEMLRFEEC